MSEANNQEPATGFSIPHQLREAISSAAQARGTNSAELIAAVLANAFGSDWLLRVVLREGEWKDGKYLFDLTRPIFTEDGEQKSLTFREPNGADIMAIGNPVKFNPISNPPVCEIKDDIMGQMIARCANITPVFLGKMTPKDMINAGWVLAPFFMPV
jgi:hypothetical protein